ncbi:PTS system mannose/fructose/sorbose family transporter subunit IID [Eubacteriales bacterium OttesenSCG-928-N14]|nr:PTS system mannose/fructose/sorbose family transporter subunit IID [Eubacteriales bacterium OttesenSCG-928-N14]
MGISLFQAILCGLWYYFCGTCWNFSLGFSVFGRGLVTGTVVGLFMGNPVMGMVIGANINLIYIGNISAGGAAPSDATAASILGTAFAIANNLSQEVAITIALPLGIIFNFRNVFHMTTNAAFAQRLIASAERGDRRGLFTWQVIAPQCSYFATGFTTIFLACYLGADVVGDAMAFLPDWLLKAMNAIGGLMPALGICMNLRTIGRKETLPFFILGFIMIKYFSNLTVLVIAVFSGIIAYVAVVGTGVHGTSLDLNLNMESKKEITGSKRLTKKDVNGSFVTWTFFSHSCYNYEIMQAGAFCLSLAKCLEKLYDGEEFAEALTRHTAFYNTQPALGGIINGIALAMEEEKANGGDITGDAVVGLKAGLMGPFAGLGDTLMQGIITPLFLGIFISMATDSETLMAPILFTLCNGGVVLFISYYMYHLGYRFGSNAVVMLLDSGIMSLLTNAAGIVGCMVLGAMSASFVKVQTPLSWVLIEADPNDPASQAYSINLQADFFDKLLLGLLPLASIFTVYALSKRGVRTNTLLIGMVLVGGVLGALGIISN